MPTLCQKENGDFIIRAKIRGGNICTWQVDDKKGFFFLRDLGYGYEPPKNEFPVELLIWLIENKYVSTGGNHIPVG